MADEIDVSQAESEFLLSLRLSQRAQYQGQSAKVCVECGDNIPLARRMALPGGNTVFIVLSAKSYSVSDNYFPHKYHRIFLKIFIEVYMKKTALNKVGISLFLFYATQFSFAYAANGKNNDLLRYLAQRDVIVGCGQYVVGYQNPSQSNQENVSQYLNYLGILSPKLERVLNELNKMSSIKIRVDIPKHIKMNNLSREQGITFCALKSQQSVDDILAQ
ncbi:hypothetical protein [Providencia rustigianii]|uniref:hypothetical protein n=1 Tax=Providencia rustigianii TaxID=158850 RepID=UPI0038B386F0